MTLIVSEHFEVHVNKPVHLHFLPLDGCVELVRVYQGPENISIMYNTCAETLPNSLSVQPIFMFSVLGGSEEPATAPNQHQINSST